jgi:hypothetical protein
MPLKRCFNVFYIRLLLQENKIIDLDLHLLHYCWVPRDLSHSPLKCRHHNLAAPSEHILIERHMANDRTTWSIKCSDRLDIASCHYSQHIAHGAKKPKMFDRCYPCCK